MWESKVAPLSGVLFGLLLLGSFLVDTNTDFMPPADEVVAYLKDGPVAVMAAAYVRLLAAAALIWFSGSLYRSLRSIDDDKGRLSLLAAAGGVMSASLITLGSVAVIAAAERVWITGLIETGAAVALFDIAGIALGNGATLGLAVMIGAWGIAKVRGADRPARMGWASVVLALALLSPYGWAVLALTIIWVPAVGVSVYRRKTPRLQPADLG